MLDKLFYIIKKIVFACLIIYSYDMFVISLERSIPINVFSVSLVSIFGLTAMVGLICFSFLFWW